jgi:hypothetical protein
MLTLLSQHAFPSIENVWAQLILKCPACVVECVCVCVMPCIHLCVDAVGGDGLTTFERAAAADRSSAIRATHTTHNTQQQQHQQLISPARTPTHPIDPCPTASTRREDKWTPRLVLGAAGADEGAVAVAQAGAEAAPAEAWWWG